MRPPWRLLRAPGSAGADSKLLLQSAHGMPPRASHVWLAWRSTGSGFVYNVVQDFAAAFSKLLENGVPRQAGEGVPA